MGRTTSTIAKPGFVVDANSIDRDGGHQIDWTKVPDSYKNTDGKKVIPAGAVCGFTADGPAVPRAASQTLTSVVVASNVATATLANHGYKVGDKLTVAGASLAYANGSIVVASVADANTFTYAATGANATATGTITAAYTAQGVIATNAIEGDASAAKSGYGFIVGGVIFENALPDASGTPKVLTSTIKAELQAAGTGFSYRQYADNRS